jgi:hypothetical protein
MRLIDCVTISGKFMGLLLYALQEIALLAGIAHHKVINV